MTSVSVVVVKRERVTKAVYARALELAARYLSVDGLRGSALVQWMRAEQLERGYERLLLQEIERVIAEGAGSSYVLPPDDGPSGQARP